MEFDIVRYYLRIIGQNIVRYIARYIVWMCRAIYPTIRLNMRRFVIVDASQNFQSLSVMLDCISARGALDEF